MVQFEELSVVYRTNHGVVKALDGVDLRLAQGEFVVVRGPSGCGKTTLLLTAGGMLRPTGGRVILNRRDLYDMAVGERAVVRAREIGFVFQMFHLLSYLDVLENVLLAADPSRGGSSKAAAEQLLADLGLGDRLRHKPAELSTGERQRVALARALVNEPQLVLADEPTGNLDPENSTAVLEHLKAFQRGGGTVMVVTHGSAADAYADRVVRMRSGTIANGE